MGLPLVPVGRGFPDIATGVVVPVLDGRQYPPLEGDRVQDVIAVIADLAQPIRAAALDDAVVGGAVLLLGAEGHIHVVLGAGAVQCRLAADVVVDEDHVVALARPVEGPSPPIRDVDVAAEVLPGPFSLEDDVVLVVAAVGPRVLSPVELPFESAHFPFAVPIVEHVLPVIDPPELGVEVPGILEFALGRGAVALVIDVIVEDQAGQPAPRPGQGPGDPASRRVVLDLDARAPAEGHGPPGVEALAFLRGHLQGGRHEIDALPVPQPEEIAQGALDARALLVVPPDADDDVPEPVPLAEAELRRPDMGYAAGAGLVEYDSPLARGDDEVILVPPRPVVGRGPPPLEIPEPEGAPERAGSHGRCLHSRLLPSSSPLPL
jgi:hypothetical protein